MKKAAENQNVFGGIFSCQHLFFQKEQVHNIAVVDLDGGESGT